MSRSLQRPGHAVGVPEPQSHVRIFGVSGERETGNHEPVGMSWSPRRPGHAMAVFGQIQDTTRGIRPKPGRAAAAFGQIQRSPRVGQSQDSTLGTSQLFRRPGHDFAVFDRIWVVSTRPIPYATPRRSPSSHAQTIMVSFDYSKKHNSQAQTSILINLSCLQDSPHFVIEDSCARRPDRDLNWDRR